MVILGLSWLIWGDMGTFWDFLGHSDLGVFWGDLGTIMAHPPQPHCPPQPPKHLQPPQPLCVHHANSFNSVSSLWRGATSSLMVFLDNNST